MLVLQPLQLYYCTLQKIQAHDQPHIIIIFGHQAIQVVIIFKKDGMEIIHLVLHFLYYPIQLD